MNTAVHREGSPSLWGKTFLQYSNTDAELCTINPVKKPRVEEGDRVFEEVFDRSVTGDKPRVVIRKGVHICDADVPTMANHASQWEQLSQPDSSISVAKIMVAELLYRFDGLICSKLNSLIAAGGGTRGDFVSSSIYKYSSRFVSAEERALLKSAITDTFTAILGPCNVDLVMEQWLTAVDWMRTRVNCVHPLSYTKAITPKVVADLKTKLDGDAEYEPVKFVTAALLRVAEQSLGEGTPATTTE